MCTPSISIIMPLYNGEPWVELAIESVLIQKGVTWELLVIDDGSTDKSPALVQKYAQRDVRISLIPNTHTKGLSGTRNTALEHVRGKYFIYLDCDDFLWENSLQALFTLAENTKAPLIRGCMTFFNALSYYANSFELNAEEMYQQKIPAHHIPQQSGAHMYLLSFIKEHHLQYDEDLHCSEDTLFLYKAYSLVKAIPILIEPNYIYILDHKTINYTPIYILSLCTSLGRLLKFLETQNEVARALPYAQYFLTKWIQQIYIMQNEPQEVFSDFLQKGLFCITYPAWDITPQLTTILGAESEEFYTYCKQGKTAELLLLLEKKQLIASPPPYRAFTHTFSFTQKMLLLYPRRVRNFITEPMSRKCLCYFLKLRWNKFWRR